MMTQPFVKQSPTTLRVLLLISLIVECWKSGDEETVSFLCKSMTQYLSNTQRRGRTKSFRGFKKPSTIQLVSSTEEIL